MIPIISNKRKAGDEYSSSLDSDGGSYLASSTPNQTPSHYLHGESNNNNNNNDAVRNPFASVSEEPDESEDQRQNDSNPQLSATTTTTTTKPSSSGAGNADDSSSLDENPFTTGANVVSNKTTVVATTASSNDPKTINNPRSLAPPIRPLKPHCPFCPYPNVPLHALKPWQQIRARLHDFLDDPTSSFGARVWSMFIVLSITLSVFAFCLETIPEWSSDGAWDAIEIVVVVIFTVEYVCRLACSSNLWRWLIQPLNVVDFLAILPFYLNIIANAESARVVRIFRIVRLVRIFRLFKIARYSSYMQILLEALVNSADAFGLLLFFIMLAVIMFSSFMYYAERGDQQADGTYLRSDGTESPFTSIPATFYWCIVTMTTVGYGDIVPVTPLGKFIASLTMICGILVIALPVSILGSNFQDVYTRKRKKPKKKATTAVEKQMEDHVSAIRRHRKGLEETLKQLRMLLQTHAPDINEFYQIWTTVDFVILNGLSRVEEFLSGIKLAQEFTQSVGLKLKFSKMAKNNNNNNNNNSAKTVTVSLAPPSTPAPVSLLHHSQPMNG